MKIMVSPSFGNNFLTLFGLMVLDDEERREGQRYLKERIRKTKYWIWLKRTTMNSMMILMTIMMRMKVAYKLV